VSISQALLPLLPLCCCWRFHLGISGGSVGQEVVDDEQRSANNTHDPGDEGVVKARDAQRETEDRHIQVIQRPLAVLSGGLQHGALLPVPGGVAAMRGKGCPPPPATRMQKRSVTSVGSQCGCHGPLFSQVLYCPVLLKCKPSIPHKFQRSEVSTLN
jgi:hypothetical protein